MTEEQTPDPAPENTLEATETEGEVLPEILPEVKEPEQNERFATYQKPEEILKEMKIRLIPFDRRKILRVVAPFNHDGKDYQVGEVFDWVALKMKPYFVQRLYSRKVVRHVVQDARTTYPFRIVRNDAPVVSDVESSETPETAETQSGALETPSETPIEPQAATEAPKFSKKNAHKRK